MGPQSTCRADSLAGYGTAPSGICDVVPCSSSSVAVSLELFSFLISEDYDILEKDIQASYF